MGLEDGDNRVVEVEAGAGEAGGRALVCADQAAPRGQAGTCARPCTSPRGARGKGHLHRGPGGPGF